jgi:hypothetical protein
MLTSWTIQPGQRLTTRSERNFAREEITNHVRPKERRMIGRNASEGIEPRNLHRRAGPKVSSPGSQERDMRVGEYATTCRGLSPWQVIQRLHRNLGEPWRSQKEAFNEAEEVRRKYDGMGVLRCLRTAAVSWNAPCSPLPICQPRPAWGIPLTSNDSRLLALLGKCPARVSLASKRQNPVLFGHFSSGTNPASPQLRNC